MKNISLLFTCLILLGCSQVVNKEDEKNQNDIFQEPDTLTKNSSDYEPTNAELIFSNGKSKEDIELEGKTVIIVEFDSAETEQIKRTEGESRFYTATDDLMYYNSMMLEKMDSIGIKVIYTDKDTIILNLKDYEKTITKDTSFTFYTYYYFDGHTTERSGVFELLGREQF